MLEGRTSFFFLFLYLLFLLFPVFPLLSFPFPFFLFPLFIYSVRLLSSLPLPLIHLFSSSLVFLFPSLHHLHTVKLSTSPDGNKARQAQHQLNAPARRKRHPTDENAAKTRSSGLVRASACTVLPFFCPCRRSWLTRIATFPPAPLHAADDPGKRDTPRLAGMTGTPSTETHAAGSRERQKAC